MALAILQGKCTDEDDPTTALQLSPTANRDLGSTARSSSKPRYVKNVPANFAPSLLFGLCRAFGPIAHARIDEDGAVVQFWNEEDARAAQDSIATIGIEGRYISMSAYNPYGLFCDVCVLFAARMIAYIPQNLADSVEPSHLRAHFVEVK